MPDVLIRNVPEATLAALDAIARQQGLSRNEYIRRQLVTRTRARQSVEVKDLERAASASADLLDADVMKAAWDGR